MTLAENTHTQAGQGGVQPPAATPSQWFRVKTAEEAADALPSSVIALTLKAVQGTATPAQIVWLREFWQDVQNAR